MSNERTNSEVHNVSNVGLETIASHYYTDQRRPRAYYNVCRHRAHRVLDNLGLGQLVGLFRQQVIDFDVLPDLTDGDLEKLGVPLGPRKKRRCSDIYQQRC